MTSPASLARTETSFGIGTNKTAQTRPSSALAIICCVAFLLVIGAVPRSTNARAGFGYARSSSGEKPTQEEPGNSRVHKQPLAGTVAQARDDYEAEGERHFSTSNPSCNAGQSSRLNLIVAAFSPNVLLPSLATHDTGLHESESPLASLAPSAAAPVLVCRGKCWDPHQGPFRYWNGQQNGCWIQVWRSWADGCSHFQWYNSCNGYWDSNPNGAPKVYWSCCVH